eukprot:TRINITY_DN38692_c0_g1_i1.p1 TRINITY_DN38692_c0_g1~~TRINITY_DN38692_c0_g1_i1.p1  ORF type:complete len:258 (+),score=65.80 TRINITY_DN38692_c0_g1_i1:151-924(+)
MCIRDSLEGVSPAACLVFFTPEGDEATTMADLTTQLHATLLQAASSDRPVLALGHSFGSVLLFETLRRHGPCGVVGLVLMCWIHDSDYSGFAFREDPRREDIAIEAMTQMNLMSTTVAFQARDTCIALAKLFFAEGSLEDGIEMLKSASWNGALSNPRGPVVQSLSRNFDFGDVISTLNLPCLSMVGAEDQRLPPSYFDRIADGLPQGSMHVCVEGAGHFPFVERQDEVAAWIAEFVGSVVNSASATGLEHIGAHTN